MTKTRPTILLTNDDSLGAAGIRALEDAMREVAGEVWVVAPLEEKSATSHALSLRTPIRFRLVPVAAGRRSRSRSRKRRH